MEDKRVANEVANLIEQRDQAEKEISSVLSWWMCQLDKHRPDLSKRLFEAEQIKKKSNKELKRIRDLIK